MSRTRQQSRFTALDIYWRNVCREFCGSAQQGACWPSRAACRGAFAASANPLSRSVFLVRASRQIKVVRCQLSFKRSDLDRSADRETKIAVRAPLIDRDFGESVRILVPERRARWPIAEGLRALQHSVRRNKQSVGR